MEATSLDLAGKDPAILEERIGATDVEINHTGLDNEGWEEGPVGNPH